MKKKITCYLVVNWKDEGIRVVHNLEKAKLTPYDIVISTTIMLSIPDTPILAEIEVEIPETQVSEMVLESLTE